MPNKNLQYKKQHSYLGTFALLALWSSDIMLWITEVTVVKACQRFKKKATSMDAAVEFKHPLFQLERNTKHNGRIFTRYPVNASENGDFNRGRKSFQANTMLKIMTRMTTEWIRRICFFIEASVWSLALNILKSV